MVMGSEGVQMTVVADAVSTGLAHDVNMDINAATGAVSDCETFVDTVENLACMETDSSHAYHVCCNIGDVSA